LINKAFSFLSGKKNIRLRMFWSFILSIFIAILATKYIEDTVYSFISFLAVFFAAFLFLTRRIVQDMFRLGEGLAVIAQGNLGHRVPLHREDELGQVARNINAMAEQLAGLIEKERRVEKSKMELITGVSHDLRTPLTSIIGYLELLKSKSYLDEEERDRFIANTYSKTLHLKELVDDLFAYTRLTASETKLKLVPIDVRELLKQMAAEFQPIAGEHGVDVHQSFPDEPIPLQADPDQLVRAVDNLLMNALKFSVKPGVVGISLTVWDGHATIDIENQGVPITKEQEALLFERFYKVDDSRTGQPVPSGSGLGLSIAKSIVELHGGRLSLLHNAGHFDFRIELPL